MHKIILNLNIFISIAIAILYPFFFNKLSSLIIKDDKVKKKHEVLKYINVKTGKKYNYLPTGGFILDNKQEEYNANDYQITDEYTENEERLANINTKRFYILLTSGVVSVIIGTLLTNQVASLGISFGGIIVILYATYLYWYNINEYMKLGLTGVSIIALIVTAYKFGGSLLLTRK